MNVWRRSWKRKLPLPQPNPAASRIGNLFVKALKPALALYDAVARRYFSHAPAS